jgi:hypothetical protein
VGGGVDSTAVVTTARRPSLRVVADVCCALALAFVLGVVYLVDSRMTTSEPGAIEQPQFVDATLPPPEPAPLPARPPVDPTRRVSLQTTPDGRFGLLSLTGNPFDSSDDGKRLTFSPDGKTNNTRVMVDGQTPVFGDSAGQTLESWHAPSDDSMAMTWSFRDVVVRQTLRFVPGEVSNRIDTIRVNYELKNLGPTTRQVGLRVMLDTLIGDNDGVPFIVPGREGIVTSTLEMRGNEVPDFVRSLERPDLASPGVIVDINLVPAEGEVRPSELVLSHWPGENAEWNYNRTTPFGSDTAAGIYYAAVPLEPGRARSIGFSYGLGTISSTATRNARLSLTAGGPIRASSSFWLVALVNQPRSGQIVRLVLPQGLTARRPKSLAQPVQGSGSYTQLSWLVEVDPEVLGDVQVQAVLEPGNVTEKQSLNVQPPDAQLSLVPRGPFRTGRPFWVSALIHNPRSGQSVTLTLPDGLTLSKGHTARVAVGTLVTGGYAQVSWLVNSGPHIDGRRDISAQLAPDDVHCRATVEIKPGDLTH